MSASHCAWCKGTLAPDLRALAVFCSQKCRQAAYRARMRTGELARAAVAWRFAYADPPYPGRAQRLYAQPEVDHAALIARLSAGHYGGWALSTSEDSLRALLPLCPPEVRVCPWVKPIGDRHDTRGLHNTWEPLLVVGGRQEPPGVRDWLLAQPARFGGELPGRKPLAFAAFLFRVLGMRPGDHLDDLYPGSGVISAAWREIGRASPTAGSDGNSSETSVRTAPMALHAAGACSEDPA
jgi:hypothetical protein